MVTYLKLELQAVGEVRCRFWDPNSSPLQEQQAVLTTESSPASVLRIFTTIRSTRFDTHREHQIPQVRQLSHRTPDASRVPRIPKVLSDLAAIWGFLRAYFTLLYRALKVKNNAESRDPYVKVLHEFYDLSLKELTGNGSKDLCRRNLPRWKDSQDFKNYIEPQWRE
ncbi:hypothetical protein STEG23_008598 [Scotinomys teguina]